MGGSKVQDHTPRIYSIRIAGGGDIPSQLLKVTATCVIDEHMGSNDGFIQFVNGGETTAKFRGKWVIGYWVEESE